LTINNSKFKEYVTTLISKIIIINDDYVEIDFNTLSSTLNYMGITRLNIFSIDNIEGINKIVVKRPSEILFIELGSEEFVKFLNNPNENFLDYNKNSLYILRNSNYRDIKLLFNEINNHKVDIGRGAGQKSHIINPLEFRLYSYLMGMFNFNYNKLNKLSTNNHLDKFRYLPFINKKTKKK